MSKTLKCILFDLDETLYPSQSGLMARIGELMSRYMEERLGMSPSEVPTLREHYYHTYGTTIVSAAACRARSPLRSYRLVVVGELWPASSEATLRSTPWSSSAEI